MEEINNNNANTTHVAVLVFPFSSHPSIILAMVRRLATSSSNTLFSFFGTAESNKSIFSSSSIINNVKPYDVWDGVPDDYVFSGRHHEDIELFMNSAATSFKKEIDVAVAHTGRQVNVVVTDAFLWFGAQIAEELGGVPWVACWTSGSIALASHIYTDLIRESFGRKDGNSNESFGRKDGSSRESFGRKDGNSNESDDLITYVPGMSEIRISDLPSGIVSGDLGSVFHGMLHKAGRILPDKAAAVLINTFHELEPDTTNHLKSKLKNALTIGSFNNLSTTPQSEQQQPAQDTYGCISWLDKRKPGSVVYIGFGSVASPSPQEVVALGEALEASGVPYLWSLSKKDKLKDLLPKNGKGLVVPWAPQKKVLSHEAVGLFVTHGGWSSVMESIASGVPLICRPFFGDQALNSRIVEAIWGTGVTVRVFTKEEIMRNLDLILRGEKGKKMKEKLRVMKLAVETSVGPKGSATQNFKTLLNLVSGSN